MTPDTSAEATRQILSALREGPNLMFDADVADFIEAVAAERDAQAERSSEAHAALKHEVLRCEAMRADRDRLAAEVARLRGHIGEAIRCIGDGCEDEADKVLRAALNGGTDND